MRKSIVPVLALGAVFALLLAAVANAGPGRGHGRRGFGGPVGADRLAQYLSLTDAQKAQVEQLQEKTKQTLEPLFEEHRQLAEEVRTALESGADAATVGTAAIAAHEHREKMRAVREQHEASLKAILTPAQLERWEALQDARKMRGGPGRGFDGPDGD